MKAITAKDYELLGLPWTRTGWITNDKDGNIVFGLSDDGWEHHIGLNADQFDVMIQMLEDHQRLTTSCADWGRVCAKYSGCLHDARVRLTKVLNVLSLQILPLVRAKHVHGDRLKSDVKMVKAMLQATLEGLEVTK